MFITITQRLYQNWATKGPITHALTYLTSTLSPLLKLTISILLLWYMSGIHKQRALTAYVSAILGSFVTFGYLQSMFYYNKQSSSHHDVELSHVALFLLALNASFVCAALGSLLPRPMAGVTLGCGLGLLCGAFVPSWMMIGLFSGGGSSSSLSLFTFIGPVLSLVGGILTTR